MNRQRPRRMAQPAPGEASRTEAGPRPAGDHLSLPGDPGLARQDGDDCRSGHEVAERFELYYRGIELANGYHELSDAAEQRRRFEAVNAARVADGRPALPLPRELARRTRARPARLHRRRARLRSTGDAGRGQQFDRRCGGVSAATWLSRVANCDAANSLLARDGLVPKASHQVVVHHADGLHVGVDDRAADELEAALFEVLAQGVGFLRRGGQSASCASSGSGSVGRRRSPRCTCRTCRTLPAPRETRGRW